MSQKLNKAKEIPKPEPKFQILNANKKNKPKKTKPIHRLVFWVGTSHPNCREIVENNTGSGI
jgi:hypothetical protein